MKNTNGFIYQIYCPDGEIGDVYIGSSTNKRLNDRFCNHKVHYRHWKLGTRSHITSFNLFEKYGVENCIIEALEYLSFTNKSQLVERERYYIDNMLCINIQLPGRTKKQYAIDNKDHLKIKAQENKIKNWEAIQQRKKAYNDSYKEQYRMYCEKNSEKFKTLINCECGSVVTSRNYVTHIKTKKHIDYLASKIIS